MKRAAFLTLAALVIFLGVSPLLPGPAAAGSDPDHFSFLVFGDSQGAYSSHIPLYGTAPFNKLMLNSISQKAAEMKPDFTVFTGDMINWAANDGDYSASMNWRNNFQFNVQAIYDAGIPMYMVVGNHDLYENDTIIHDFATSAIEQLFSGQWSFEECQPRAFSDTLLSMQQAYQRFFKYLPDNGPPGHDYLTYSFNWGNSYFAVLDSYYIVPVTPEYVNGIIQRYDAGIDPTDAEIMALITGTVKKYLNEVDPAQIAWLQQPDQAEGQYKHKFVFTHAPIFPVDGGCRQEDLFNVIDKYAFEAIFTGHSHLYAREIITKSYTTEDRYPFEPYVVEGENGPFCTNGHWDYAHSGWAPGPGWGDAYREYNDSEGRPVIEVGVADDGELYGWTKFYYESNGNYWYQRVDVGHGVFPDEINDVVQYVSGGAGAPLEPAPNNPNLNSIASECNFIYVTVDDYKITTTTYVQRTVEMRGDAVEPGYDGEGNLSGHQDDVHNTWAPGPGWGDAYREYTDSQGRSVIEVGVLNGDGEICEWYKYRYDPSDNKWYAFYLAPDWVPYEIYSFGDKWRYDFTYHYSDGDRYTGYVITDGPIYDNEYNNKINIPHTDQNGPGYYEITHRGHLDNEPEAGLVQVINYYDHETADGFIINLPSSTGFNGKAGLGSESGWFRTQEQDFVFGNYYNNGILLEADPPMSKYAFVKYDFDCKYENGNGDWYSGSFWGQPKDFPYGVGDKIPFVDENTQPGYYEIKNLTCLRWNDMLYGKVQVSSYHDHESGQTFSQGNLGPWGDQLGYGDSGLRSESGYLSPGSKVAGFHFGRNSAGTMDEADVSLLYHFSFAYPGSADYYVGQGYMAPGYYTAGQSIRMITEGGGYGAYYIDTVFTDRGAYDPEYAGKVSVLEYYDQESDFHHIVHGQGTNYLGSESGDLYYGVEEDCYKFGYGSFYSSSSWNMLGIITWGILEADAVQLYEFRFNYGEPNNEWYEGFGYAPPDREFQEGYTKTMRTEGGRVGTYTIGSVKYATEDGNLGGMVYVETYHDGDSGKLAIVHGTGYNYLGSETGYLYGIEEDCYQFGYGSFYSFSSGNILGKITWGILEAEVVRRYEFRFNYNDPNDEWYEGYGFAPPGHKFQVGYTDNTKRTEDGGAGTYTITKEEPATVDGRLSGEVYVTQYHDGDSGQTIHVSGAGSGFLGSESGFLYAGVEEDCYKFGYGVIQTVYGIDIHGILEADVVQRYEFRFNYGEPNDEWYEGYGYAAPDRGYKVGATTHMQTESGGVGTYTVTKVEPGDVDASLAGMVYVTHYHDGDSGQTVDLPASRPAGHDYLRTEAGYLYDTQKSYLKFGLGSIASKDPRGGYITFIYEADIADKYTFRYAYDPYNHGDYSDSYEGYVYAGPTYDYFAGANWQEDVANELGNHGSYEIIDASWEGVAATEYGKVYVTGYHDGESNTDFVPVQADAPAGFAYLASEAGYIKKERVADYLFSHYYEADAGDTFTFQYTYGNGDSYTGKFYAAPDSQYYPGWTSAYTDANETGYVGNYEITGMSYAGAARTDYGKVYLTSYYNGDTSKATFVPVNYPVPAGTNYLGSEQGYIKQYGVAAFFFSRYYEADVLDTFAFKYTYGNGDSYTGRVYASPTSVYFPGWKSAYTTANESGKVGNYEITGMSYSGVASADYGKVYVASYDDGDASQLTFVPVNATNPAGTDYLGSEEGYIKQTGVANYRFSKYYEADAGNVYTFEYIYGNGDYYTGTVYADPQMYYVNWQSELTANETGKLGYYVITGESFLSSAPNYYGQVDVTSYYDGDRASPKLYTQNSLLTTYTGDFYWGFGSNYLGSEYGYITQKTTPYYFGGAYWEADGP